MNQSQQQFDRRSLLSLFGLAALGSSLGFARSERPKRILLRSSWQTVNIGDIAHAPGVLRILETHLPDALVTLWPSNVDNGVKELLQSRFPKLKIAPHGSDALKRAFEECDFLLHGSGASLVAERDVIRWRDETCKPYGIYGITLPPKKSSSTQATSKETGCSTSTTTTTFQRLCQPSSKWRKTPMPPGRKPKQLARLSKNGKKKRWQF